VRPRSAAVVATRVIALWIGIEALTSAISYAISIADAGDISGTGGFWAYVITRGVIAVLLWTRAGEIGDALARGTADGGTETPGRSANVHAIAFSVVGLILAVNAVTGLIGSALTSFDFGGPGGFGFGGGFFGFASGRGAAIVVHVVTLGIGVSLLFGSGPLAGYLSRSYPAQDPPSAPPPTA
jgi:hypothetical protein